MTKIRFDQILPAFILTLALISAPVTGLRAADIELEPPADGAVIIKDGANNRMLIYRDGRVEITGLPGSTQQEQPVCFDATTGELGSCPGAALPTALLNVLTRTAFVTSGEFSGDLVSAATLIFPATCSGVVAGVPAADCICQAHADAAGLAGTYLAWISDNNANTAPATRFTQATQPYVLPDFNVIAENWDDLIDGTLAAPLNVTETGGVPVGGDRVWTNVSTIGQIFNLENTCNNWTDNSAVAPFGAFGVRTATDGGWTSPEIAQECFGAAHLYCFEQ